MSNRKLPVPYITLRHSEKSEVRDQFVEEQDGACYFCGAPLWGPPSKEQRQKHVDRTLFPDGFFRYPVHLHHSHVTGMTLGAVHNVCNAILWQYHGE